MNNNLLVVINNEKVSKNENGFYSRNYNFKILPESDFENFLNTVSTSKGRAPLGCL